MTVLIQSSELMAQNILESYFGATEETREYGRSWYADANAFAQDLAEQHGLSLEATSGIIAALSPRCRWRRNKKVAELVAAGIRPTGIFGRQVDKAFVIRSGIPAGLVLSGPKERSFADNIRAPFTSDAVTCDYVAVNVAVASVEPLEGGEIQRIIERRGGYVSVANAYRLAADDARVRPLVMQAVTWIDYRESHE